MNPKGRTSIFLSLLMISSVLIWTPSVIAADGDNDGFDDSIDDCLYAAGSSTNTLMGCPDSDLNGLPDSLQGTVSDFTNAGRDYEWGDEMSGGISEYTSSSRSSKSRAIDVAPNGMVAVGADSGNQVYIASGSGKILNPLFSIDSDPRGLDFSPNGSLLAVAGYETESNEANVHVFQMDWNTLSANHIVNLSANHDDDTFGIAFSLNGDELYVGGKDENVTIYDTSTWTILHQIPFEGDDIYHISPSPDGRLIAVTHAQELSIYWTSNATQFLNVHNHSDIALGLDWSPDGRWVISGGNDNRIRVYDTSNGSMITVIDHGSDVWAIDFNQAGTHFVAAASSSSETAIYSTADWTATYSFGDFPGGSGSGASGRRGARDVAWSADETKIYFGTNYYGGFYTFYSADAYIWMGGDVTGQLMESRFLEYADVGFDYLPNHYNSTITPITQQQCNQAANIQGILMGAGSTTSAESLTTPLANYSTSGLRSCDSNGDLLVDVPVARMPATLIVKANGVAEQCLTTMGGLSMGQIRWLLSGASTSDLMNNGFHPGMDLTSVAPNDDGDGEIEWRDLHSSCDEEPIHTYHRWENRSVPQMLDSFLFCGHCDFPEDWYAPNFDRFRLVQETRSEIISGVIGFDGAIGITELRSGIESSGIYNVPIFDNWTHGASDLISYGHSPIQPTVENSSSGAWPFQGDYFLTMREDQVSESQNFINWMLSESGQENFDEIGFVRLDPFSRVQAGDRVGLDLRSILPDDDGDGIWNGEDLCPNTESNLVVNSDGCAQNQIDEDNDGYVNSIDDCPNQYGTSTVPTIGCPDADGDSWADTADAFPSEPSQWNDTDGDGYGDEPDAYQSDTCPDEYGLSMHDRYGCIDTDGDGWSNLNDMFPGNPSQWVDADGDGVGDNYTWGSESNGLRVSESGDAFPNDSTQHKDRDGDGYGDNHDGILADTCPSEYGTSNMGGKLGCPDTDADGWADSDDDFPNEATQHIDTDGDGYGDSLSGNLADYCVETPFDEITLVNNLGCAPSERDGDYDGVSDADDNCLNTPELEVLDVDVNGCSESERDTDGDGAIDSVDEYENDPTQTIDSDGDGYGDNSSGNNGDDCPGEFGTSSGNLRGCIDSDGDTWADTEDVVPNIITQWNDTDGDGYYDNYANSLWSNDELRVNGSWPGQLIPGARDPDRCPLQAWVEGTHEFDNENPGCPDDVYPAGQEDDGDNRITDPNSEKESDGGISTTMIILIATFTILLIAVGGAVSLSLSKPKKKSKKRTIVREESTAPEIVEEPQEELAPEDDPNYKVDENGCEWWYDEGAWWYRTPEMDDWAEYGN